MQRAEPVQRVGEGDVEVGRIPGYIIFMVWGSIAEWVTGGLTAAGVLAAVQSIRASARAARALQASQVAASCRLDDLGDGRVLAQVHVVNTSGAPVYELSVNLISTDVRRPIGEPTEYQREPETDQDFTISRSHLLAQPSSGIRSKSRRSLDFRWDRIMRPGGSAIILKPYAGRNHQMENRDVMGTLLPSEAMHDRLEVTSWRRGYALLFFTDGLGTRWKRDLITHQLIVRRRKNPYLDTHSHKLIP